jgi:hypothetical protein
MTLKSRLAGLVTILVLFAMAPSVFAQVQITIIPDVDNGDINTNNNAVAAVPGTTGSGVLVVGSLIATSPLTTTKLRIAYPGPIMAIPAVTTPTTTNGNGTIAALASANCTDGAAFFTCGDGRGVPVPDPIRISGASGVFSNVGQALLNTTLQRIEVILPGTSGATNSSSGSFRLVGVRINANGLSGAQTVTASLNNTVNNYLIGSPSTGTVINTLNPGIAAGTPAIGLAPGNTTIGGALINPGAGAGTILTNGTVARTQGSFILTEGCASCWRSALQNSNSGTPTANSTQIRLTFNNVPAGVTLNLGLSFGNQTSLRGTLNSTTITSASNTAVIDITGSSLTTTETWEVDFTIVSPLPSTTGVATPGTITVTASMFPIGTGIDSTATVGGVSVSGVPTDAAGYPTFTALEAGPLTVVNIVPANTTMLMPYAITLSPFDTGIAIANTSADPFGPGAGGLTPKGGTITLNFFPTTSTGGAGTPFSLTTSTTVKPGLGLSSDGTLAAGATWTVLMSQLLSAAGQTGTFTGYIFIQANFLGAHGTATISDFRTYSLTANVLVLPPPATVPRASSGTSGAESLDF